MEQREICPLEKLNGNGINVLVSEDVPRNLDQWPDLQWVQLLAAGVDHLERHPIWHKTIPVTTASGLHGVPMAQFVTGAWLMMAHQMPKLLNFQSSRKWPDRNPLNGHTVRDLTAGLVGYGSIGRECGRQLHALGMRVVCLKRNPSDRLDKGYNAWPGTGDPEGNIPDRWFSPTQIGAMLPLCDLLVITAPRTPQTLGMIGRAEISLLKPSARIIIISRGGIVDEPALVEALRAQRIAGAAVDCYVSEPPSPEHPFFALPNVIMTPHVSGFFTSFLTEVARLLGENYRRFRQNVALLNQVDAGLGY